MLTSLIVWAIVGLIAGWITGQIMKGSDYGVVGNIIVGLIGAVVGGFLAQTLFGVNPVDGLDVSTVVTAVIGAVIFTALLNALTGRRAR